MLALRRADIVHEVQLEVVQVDVGLLDGRRAVEHDRTEDVGRFRRRHFDVGADSRRKNEG